MIVDKENTGEVRENVRWQYGLHDFLEIKHHQSIGQDGGTSIYYSNLKYFTSYKSDLYGMTGTLGSSVCRKFLSEIYNVDTLEIPTFQYKQFTKLKDIICQTEDEWKNQIILKVKETIQNERPVLVIMETIIQAQEMATLLNRLKIKTITYYNSLEENLHLKVEKIFDPVAIIATNLAGRGTDI